MKSSNSLQVIYRSVTTNYNHQMEERMTILPPAVLTTAQLVSGLVASVKNALDIARASSDHALKGAVSELYDSFLDVKGRVLDLDEENRALKVALAERNKYIGPVAPHGYYFVAGDKERPLCPRCFQENPQKIAFLTSPHEWNRGIRRTCKLCRHHVYEKEMEL